MPFKFPRQPHEPSCDSKSPEDTEQALQWIQPPPLAGFGVHVDMRTFPAGFLQFRLCGFVAARFAG